MERHALMVVSCDLEAYCHTWKHTLCYVEWKAFCL